MAWEGGSEMAGCSLESCKAFLERGGACLERWGGNGRGKALVGGVGGSRM